MRRFNHFCFGGCGYYLIEHIFRTVFNRGEVHWTMFVLGGLSFMAIMLVDEMLRYNIVIKSLISGCIITIMEFILGCTYKYILHDPIWTYGTADFLGVISFTWSLLWCFFALCVMAINRLLSKIIYNTK